MQQGATDDLRSDDLRPDDLRSDDPGEETKTAEKSQQTKDPNSQLKKKTV